MSTSVPSNFKKYSAPILRVMYHPITDIDLDEKLENVWNALSEKDRYTYVSSPATVSQFHPPPKVSCTAYNLYVKEMWKPTRMKHKEMSCTAVTQKVAEMWSTLDKTEKDRFKELARTIRDNYHVLFERWSFIDKMCVELFRNDHPNLPSQTQWEMWVDLNISGKETYLSRATEIWNLRK